MYLLIKSIVLFFAKVVLIEWIIELCRSMVYWVQCGTFPEKFFLEDENRFLHWTMNCVESACVVLLLYLDFNVYFIIRAYPKIK